jgi:serine-type D-Ala-D-Ala carboxypeptidase/endopeptidase (penicillin-binding protein 4)
MKKLLLSTTSAILLLFWPIQAQDRLIPEIPIADAQPPATTRLTMSAEAKYLNELALRGFSLETQGLLIESLDGSAVYSELNSNTAFNPASVIKVATSFTALSKFGPDYQFETGFYSDGSINPKTHTLNGDLILHSTGDPVLNSIDVSRLLKQVLRAGIRRVSGNLVVTGPFTFGSNWTTERALRALNTSMRKVGIRVAGGTKSGAIAGKLISSHSSPSLRNILFNQNAHSSNPTAERVGEAVGGAKAVQQFLVEQIGIPDGDVYISHTSGLEYNRITPRGTVQLFRELVFWLNLQNMQPQDVLPVAGMDPGTLRTRFASVEYRGGIIAKTGTLPGTDGGVSTLAGILYTRERGPILFAIFNTRGPVTTYRRLQDSFIKGLIMECGGIPVVNASLRKASN